MKTSGKKTRLPGIRRYFARWFWRCNTKAAGYVCERPGGKSDDMQSRNFGSAAKHWVRLGQGIGQKAAKCGATMNEARGIILKRLAQGTRGEKRYGFGGAGNAGAAGYVCERPGGKSDDMQSERCGSMAKRRARLGEGRAQKQSAARYEWDKEMILKRLAGGKGAGQCLQKA